MNNPLEQEGEVKRWMTGYEVVVNSEPAMRKLEVVRMLEVEDGDWVRYEDHRATLSEARDEVIAEVREKLLSDEAVDPVAEQRAIDELYSHWNDGVPYPGMEANKRRRYAQLAKKPGVQESYKAHVRKIATGLLAALDFPGEQEKCETCGEDREVEVEEMRGAQFVPVAKPCPDCTQPKGTLGGETVVVILKRATAQDLSDRSPEHTPGEVFPSLTPAQLDLKYALQRALAPNEADDSWPPVLLFRDRPGAILGFAGSPEFIAGRGGETARYVPALPTQPVSGEPEQDGGDDALVQAAKVLQAWARTKRREAKVAVGPEKQQFAWTAKAYDNVADFLCGFEPDSEQDGGSGEQGEEG